MEQEKKEGSDFKRNFNIAFGLCVAHQRCLTIITRKGFGKNALSLPCLVALVVMFLWTMFTRDSLMWAWIGLWLMCFVKRRVESVRASRSGAIVHSQYDGWPFDAIRFAPSEKMAKLVVEPLLVGIFGAILYVVYGHMGWRPGGLPTFILTGVFTLPVVEGMKQAIWEKQTQSILDSRIEQEGVMRDFHNKYGNY